MKRRLPLLLVFTALLLIAFYPAGDEQQAQLQKVAQEYTNYALYHSLPDKENMEWTIAPCAPAIDNYDSRTTHFPNSVDSMHYSHARTKVSMHGNKLYKLYISDAGAYLDTAVHEQPLGQTLVKETWTVRAIPADSVDYFTLARKNLNDYKWYVPVKRSQLFIMYKTIAASTNDKGWVYGIMDIEHPDKGVKVIENGKLSNCISCHQGNKYDRIFGPATNTTR